MRFVFSGQSDLLECKVAQGRMYHVGSSAYEFGRFKRGSEPWIRAADRAEHASGEAVVFGVTGTALIYEYHRSKEMRALWHEMA